MVSFFIISFTAVWGINLIAIIIFSFIKASAHFDYMKMSDDALVKYLDLADLMTDMSLDREVTNMKMAVLLPSLGLRNEVDTAQKKFDYLSDLTK